MTLKPKKTAELLEEIAILEVQVMHLERHLLSLYEKAFDRRIISSSACSSSSDTKGVSNQAKKVEHVAENVPVEEWYDAQEQQDVLGSSIRRTHSSLSHHTAAAACALLQSSPFVVGKISDAINSYHSLPLGMLQNATGETPNNLLSNDSSQIRQTANWISEEMIRCVSTIYCKLSASSKTRNSSSSPVVSSISLLSCAESAEFHLWTPQSKMNSSLDLYSDVSLQGGCEEFSGPYSEIVEVLQICRDSDKMREIDPMLRKFSILVRRLEQINPRKLKHKEKLAFWINVHNALVMHAYLVYGVSQIKLKRVSILLKAAYKIGGHTVSVGMIQNFILGNRLPFLGQWLLQLFHRNTKLRTKDDSSFFATDHPEPLSYFALSCGTHSDPPVRVYTPKRVYQELIAARGDYILSNYRVSKGQSKVMLPKIVETYAKDSGLHPHDFQALLDHILPADIRRAKNWRYHWFTKRHQGVGWIPHDFSFRYQLQKQSE